MCEPDIDFLNFKRNPDTDLVPGSIAGSDTAFFGRSPVVMPKKKTMKNDQKISKNVKNFFFNVKSTHNPYKVIGSPLGWVTS